MKLKITTLIIIEGNQVENIYHSLEDITKTRLIRTL